MESITSSLIGEWAAGGRDRMESIRGNRSSKWYAE